MKTICKQEIFEISNKAARAFLEMGCSLYGIEKVMYVASFLSVNDLPIRNGKVVRI